MTTKPDTLNPPAPAQPHAIEEVGLPQAQDVIEQLRQQSDSPTTSRDQRTAERKPWVTQLTLLIADPLGKPRTLNVASHDISTGGFSFIYKQFLHINTRVRVHFETLAGRPALDGIVRSCIHVGGMHHRVGVQFASTKSTAKDPPKSTPRS